MCMPTTPHVHWTNKGLDDSLAACSIPIELLERILSFCCPRDIVTFSRACRVAHLLVFGSSSCSQSLWRDIFLSIFDDPRRAVGASRTIGLVDWRARAIERFKAEHAVRSSRQCDPNHQITPVLQVFISMIHDAPPALPGDAAIPSYNLKWLDRVLCLPRFLNTNEEVSENAFHAQLKVYLALTFDAKEDKGAESRLTSLRKKGRIFVYNFRNYSSRRCGPFSSDGTVDWIHLEHLVNVIVLNIRELSIPWCDIKPPMGLAATRPYSSPTNGLEGLRDWASVQGTWRRFVSFMDFRDQYAFNLGVNQQVDTTFFDCTRFREATRLLALSLYLTNGSQSRFRSLIRADATIQTVHYVQFPPIFFAGTSSDYKGNTASIEGVVRMSPDGIVRWQFTSTHPEGACWRSDGAQIGNIGSSSGVVGVWTTEFRCDDDPVGPFWLWKVEDDYPLDLMEYSR